MKKVYCIMICRNHVPDILCEICETYEVALEHRNHSCYDYVWDSGAVVAIQERHVWDE